MLLNRHRNRRTNGVTSFQDVAPSSVLTLEEMSVEDLKAYAADHGIEIGRSSSQDGILKKIKEAEESVDPEAEEAARLEAERLAAEAAGSDQDPDQDPGDEDQAEE